MDKNQFAQTPPMGWNSYDYYDTTVTEEQVRANAEYMAKHLKEYGWEYVVIDIEWYSNDAGTKRQEYQYIPFGDDEMDEYGRLQPSPKRFPSSAGGQGFKPLADYIHSLGLKFGIHIMRGIPRQAAHNHCKVLGSTATADMVADPSSICGWNPDMYGVRHTEAGQAYYDSIISMYAEWGVDFIKCDDICDSWLYRDIPQMPFSGWEETRMLHRAIERSGREIVLSLSPGPAHIDRAWEYCRYANMWRITDDFWDEWRLVKDMFARCELWQDHIRPGCFPDCDMLPVGKLGKGFGQEWDCRLNREEQKTMMTLWCMFRSPLMIGTDLPALDDWSKELLTNKALLALLGKERKGVQLMRDEKQAVWKNEDSRREADGYAGSGCEDGSCEGSSYAKTGEPAVALFNLSDDDREISVSIAEILPSFAAGAQEGYTFTLYDIWEKTETKTTDGRITAMVSAHGVAAYYLR